MRFTRRSLSALWTSACDCNCNGDCRETGYTASLGQQESEVEVVTVRDAAAARTSFRCRSSPRNFWAKSMQARMCMSSSSCVMTLAAAWNRPSPTIQKSMAVNCVVRRVATLETVEYIYMGIPQSQICAGRYRSREQSVFDHLGVWVHLPLLAPGCRRVSVAHQGGENGHPDLERVL